MKRARRVKSDSVAMEKCILKNYVISLYSILANIWIIVQVKSVVTKSGRSMHDMKMLKKLHEWKVNQWKRFSNVIYIYLDY